MPSLLVEIGCEELPSAAVYEAGRQLPALAAQHLGAEPDELFLGPRRLAFVVRDLPAETAPEWIQGPPVRVGEKAAEGFARKLGIPRKQLIERDGAWGWEKPAEPIAEGSPAKVDAIVDGLQFGKTMVWETRGQALPEARRWLLALLDENRVVGTTSFGHRFLGGAVEIESADAYAEALRAAYVEPSLEARRATIVEGLDALGAWRDPLGVLDEAVNLVEWPSVLEGRFDERFLRLPARVIETAMQSHQRYFPLEETRFAIVANGGDPETVRTGNERVLRGRLDDAAFTFERDAAVGIDALADRLSEITFFAGAGSYADKTERLVALVGELGGDDVAIAAARLAKADQASELVREFPELEGHIGAEYARLAGQPDAVCAAIDEQYLLDAADAPLPQSEAGRVLAAADKLDTLTVAFGPRARSDGLARPVCAAPGRDRPVPARARGRALLAHRRSDRPRLRRGASREPARRARGSRAGPRGAGLDDLRSIAELARFLGGLPDERLGPVHEVYTRAARSSGTRRTTRR